MCVWGGAGSSPAPAHALCCVGGADRAQRISALCQVMEALLPVSGSRAALQGEDAELPAGLHLPRQLQQDVWC